ncbi:MAG: ATP-binding protein [Halobacteriales archaeon]
MVSKRDLGVSYFLGTGLGLIVSLLGYFVLVDGSFAIASVGSLSAFGLSGSLPYIGVWLWRSDFSASRVWAVARWCAVGLLLSTIVVGGLMLTGIRPQVVLMFPHLLVNLLAAGGLTGAVLGLIEQLQRQYDRTDELNRRNEVLNRTLRHNIRNDMNVILGYVQRIGQEVDGVDDELLEPLTRKSQEVIETSAIAREIQNLDTDDADRPIDLIPRIKNRVNIVRDTHPDVEFKLDLPNQAWADVTPVFETVLDNLIENAIEHNDRAPRIEIGVETGTNDTITLSIADNGPGIPESEIKPITAEDDAANHGSGLGLWLTKWFVKQYDGEIAFSKNEPRGSIVTIELPESDTTHQQLMPTPSVPTTLTS